VEIPIRRQVLMMRTAISPRLAIRIFENIKARSSEAAGGTLDWAA
jgi:hypothetical protein